MSNTTENGQPLTLAPWLAGILFKQGVLRNTNFQEGRAVIRLFEDEVGWRLCIPYKQGEFTSWVLIANWNKPKSASTTKPTPATYDPDDVPF